MQLHTGSSKSLESTWKKSHHFVPVVLLMRQSRSVSLKDYNVYSYSQEEQHITPVEQWLRWKEYKLWVEGNAREFRRHKERIISKQYWKALWTVICHLLHNNRGIISINESKSSLHQWRAERQDGPERLKQEKSQSPPKEVTSKLHKSGLGMWAPSPAPTPHLTFWQPFSDDECHTCIDAISQ